MIVSVEDWNAGGEGDYGVQLNKREVLDGRSTQSSLGRWANDCRAANKRGKHCGGTNAKFSISSRYKTVTLKATEDIAAGSEIFVSYGKEYWKSTGSHRNCANPHTKAMQPQEDPTLAPKNAITASHEDITYPDHDPEPPAMPTTLQDTLRGVNRSEHQRVAEQWDKANKWKMRFKIDVLNKHFDGYCQRLFEKNFRPELKPHSPNKIWKLSNPNKFKLRKYKGMGMGVYTPKALKAETVVLTETGITGKRDGLRLPASLLATGVTLHAHGSPPDSYSPFPDYTLKQWNNARLMVSSNAFTVGSKRVLFNFVSRINHSCEPNLVRRHKGNKIELITTRPIRKNEQLFIQYSPESGHEDRSHFKCPCKKTLKQREKTERIGRNILQDLQDGSY